MAEIRRFTMAELTLTDKEEDMLKGILESYLSDLRMEVADTDRKGYRDELKVEEVFLKELISKLS
jgi:hypothetical protein